MSCQYLNWAFIRMLLERSSDLSTVFDLQAAHHELVLCVLPLILPMLSLKTSIEGRPVQYGQSYYHRIPQNTAGYPRIPRGSSLSHV